MEPEILRRLHRDDPRVRARSFAERRGKSSALSLGFSLAEAPIVVTMDADLQDLPEELPVMIEALKSQDLALVQAWRCRRTTRRTKSSPPASSPFCCSRHRDSGSAMPTAVYKAKTSPKVFSSAATCIALFPSLSTARRKSGGAASAPRSPRIRPQQVRADAHFHGLVGLLRVALLPRLLGHAHTSRHRPKTSSRARPPRVSGLKPYGQLSTPAPVLGSLASARLEAEFLKVTHLLSYRCNVECDFCTRIHIPRVTCGKPMSCP